MANQEQLELLKQGAEVWNKWRIDNIDAVIDLSKSDFHEADLRGVNLNQADLTEANLRGADLEKAYIFGAYLVGAQLTTANLRSALLGGSNFDNADLGKALLVGTNFINTSLSQTNFRNALCYGTVFARIDFSNTIDLDTVDHIGESIIGADTLNLSQGKIPEVFLRGCGMNDWEIESAKLYNPDLSNEEINKSLYKMYDLRATQALQISPLFISYSHADGKFVDRMEKSLNKKGIRFWRDVHDMKAGRIEKQIDHAIRQNPTVLLILSENSIQSDWVEHEVRLARKLEKDADRDILCPVALDDSWKSSPWPERIMEQIMEYNVLDFSEWEDDEKFEKMFVKLIDGLNLYYKKEEGSR